MAISRRALVNWTLPVSLISLTYGVKGYANDSRSNPALDKKDSLNNTDSSKGSKSGWVDVKAFGAVGDGITNDSEAFKKSVMFSGEAVYVPQGVYFLDEDLKGRFFGPGYRVKTKGGQEKIPFPNMAQSIGNIFYGYDAGTHFQGDDISGQVIAIGLSSCRNVSSGFNITAIGAGVLSGDTINDPLTDNNLCSGSELVAIGVNALKKSITSSNCIGIGRDALNENKHGNFNVAIGSSSLQQLHTGSANVALGRAAGMRLGIVTDSRGKRLSFNEINGMTLIGNAAGRELYKGRDNTYVGNNAGRGVTSADNKFTGTSSGSFNTVLGSGAYSSVVDGDHNTIIGAMAGSSLKNGSGNIFIGNASGADLVNSSNRFLVSASPSLPFLDGKIASKGNGFLKVNGQIYPFQDNENSLGASDLRWKQIYSSTGAILTSDKRLKDDVENITDTERRVALKLKVLIKKFKFSEANRLKGKEFSRWHFGVIAQDVEAAFESEGLNADDYGLFCRDVIAGEDDVSGSTSGPHSKVRYGIRYDELICFIIAAI
ncbi:tail fiber domain-containing protein [Erwiniaceae bacterium L1_55_4]|nr:tail fiber domain-containing protein [Erwiniaceae bacterium L1_55_4]